MRSFNDLTKPEKVQAVLATVEEPVSKTLAFTLAGIDSRVLTRQERLDVDAVLTNSSVKFPEGKRRQALYQVPLDGRHVIITALDVDTSSVNDQMADVLLEVWQEMKLSSGGHERKG